MIPEFSRRVALDTIGSGGRTVDFAADATECAALAKRFGLIRLASLRVAATLSTDQGAIVARGTVEASVAQPCVVTGDPVPGLIDETFVLRFVDPLALSEAGEDLELGEADCDVLAHDGGAVDLGEAAAQTLGLALDPFPRARTAPQDEQNWTAGAEANPFAALQGLIARP